MDLKKLIREIPDFPKPGILFRDITPLLAHPAALKLTIDTMMQAVQPLPLTAVVGIESRGFLFGVLLAQALQVPFVPIRKAGKLPFTTHSATYELEYGSAILQIHTDALKYNDQVLIVDDLLATGGTAQAAATLVKQLQARIAAFSFVIELSGLEGRRRLSPTPIYSLLSY